MFPYWTNRLNSYNYDPPPSYDSVAAMDKEGLPSYKEALERTLMQEAGNSSSSNLQSVLIDESTNSGDTSNRPDSERRPRIFDDLPPSFRYIAFDSPRRFTQSASHKSTGSEHTRVDYSSRNNQERIIINDTEDFLELTNVIYEPFSSILEEVVIDDSQSQGNSGSDSLNVHYSADNNGTDGRPWIWKLLTHDQCLYRVGSLLLFIGIMGFFLYDALILSSS